MARRKKEDAAKEKHREQKEKPLQRSAANARERARMRVLSKAFGRLKTTLPWVPPDTKLSKLDTLRLASSYIAHLKTILDDDNHDGNSLHPLNLTWPFTFNTRQLQPIPRLRQALKRMRTTTPTGEI
ncbi:PREDICTED: transcription factor 21-like [Priapulus caudatus]|uniref:Transcription factor 21-like n=1 Tax=Priapulus caudatus TaxID=37621 RepID=A0ABM1EBP3_PRICU|nr:PREDICTED: transcription factor 21-like [Priapulus caudatus]